MLGAGDVDNACGTRGTSDLKGENRSGDGNDAPRYPRSIQMPPATRDTAAHRGENQSCASPAGKTLTLVSKHRRQCTRRESRTSDSVYALAGESSWCGNEK